MAAFTILTMREGNTGILYFQKNGKEEQRFIPDYDLEKTRLLLMEFQELKNTNGKSLKDNYKLGGFDWYPSMVSFLYWRVFFPYIKYKPILNDVVDKKISIKFLNKGELYAINNIVNGELQNLRLRDLIFFSLLRINNGLVIRWFPYKLMFFRFSFVDFRSTEIRKELDNLDIKHIQVVPPGRIKEIIKYLLRKEPYYYYGGKAYKNCFNTKYDLHSLDNYKKILFQKTISVLENTISAYLKEYEAHSKIIAKSKIKVFYGFDDCNGYIFPLLYALKKKGIYTIGHQHGAYAKRHAGYIMEGISSENYQWFDKVIVWGKYWKKLLLDHSKTYTDDVFEIGSNKFKFDYSLVNTKTENTKNILIPYEFVGNTFKIGKYIEKFIELGYTIYFKPRPDEKIEDQLAAYCLSNEVNKKVIIAEKLDHDLITKIDIVAGAMTTLIYEMLPYNKIIWILDTEYKHLHDLVDYGLAHKITLDDLENLEEKFFQKTTIDVEEFFSSEHLNETLKKHIIPKLRNGALRSDE